MSLRRVQDIVAAGAVCAGRGVAFGVAGVALVVAAVLLQVLAGWLVG
jgi:hypothetical protein